MQKYYVICGTHQEYQEFAKRKAQEFWNLGISNISLSNFIYVDTEEKIKGVIDPQGFFIGRWKNNPNIESIMIALAGAIKDSKRQQVIRDLWKEYRKEP